MSVYRARELPQPRAGTPWQVPGVYCPHEEGITWHICVVEPGEEGGEG